MSIYQDLPCPRKSEGCLGKIPANLSSCPTCNTQVASPNVRMADIPEECAALQERYQAALLLAEGNGASATFQELERKLNRSQAVINMSPSFVEQMLTYSNTLYSSYQAQVGAGTRKPAELVNDRKRLAVEDMLFGSIGKEIAYSALSPDGTGLWSYGDLAVTLRDVSVANRSSLLEENSFDFMKTHKIELMAESLPLGYRSTWKGRSHLGAAKLAAELHETMSDSEINALILTSDGDRGVDKFIEIHIFGTFDNNAIAKVVSRVTRKSGKVNVVLSGIKDKAKKLGIEFLNV